MLVMPSPGASEAVNGVRTDPGDSDSGASQLPSVQVNHQKLMFVCAGCGHEYANPRDLWDCVEEHLGEEI